MNKPLETTIVIPAFNEALRLPPTLENLKLQIATGALTGVSVREVLVIDDGSADDTIGVAESAGAGLPQFRVIKSGRNFGKGHAVRLGLREAKMPWILVADADM